MGDRIQPQNNRTFKTGSGTWTGNFIWHSDTIDFHQGYITVDVPMGGGPVLISLPPPAIKITPGVFHGFGGAALRFNSGLPLVLFDWLITDGFYMDFAAHAQSGGPNYWSGIVGVHAVPLDWNIHNTRLDISVYTPSGNPGMMAFDDFTLSPPTKGTQHLPIIGIG